MAGVWVCAAVSGHFRFGLIAAGKQTAEMGTAAAGAATAIVLVPTGYHQFGIAGAAAGLFVAEALVLAASWILMARVIRPSGQFIAVEADLDRLSEVPR
jgi:O-antigen/teichoic acid export membrane protein